MKDSKEEGKGLIEFGREVVKCKEECVMGVLGEWGGGWSWVWVGVEVLEKKLGDEKEGWEGVVKEMVGR